jgi:hypothetical protein
VGFLPFMCDQRGAETFGNTKIKICPKVLNLPLREWTMANWTGEWLFSGMDTAMGSQIGSL